MPETFVQVNEVSLRVPEGATVASALLLAGVPSRTSVSGQPRSALCGMGICYECRATVNGVAHTRTCQVVCREGMVIATHAE